jgi:hypothetical protein
MSDEINNIEEKKLEEQENGIFGFGLSNNYRLDILNIVILAFAGVVIKIFFQENFSQDGTVGPASTTIWGYGLTCIALIILTFISFYLMKTTLLEKSSDRGTSSISSFTYIKLVFQHVLPIFLTLFIIFYIILLNFMFFNRINSNKVTNSYYTYSFISTILIIIQLILIVKYIYEDLEGYKKKESNKNDISIVLSKSATFILSTINLVFVVILHILLAFFSTDG